MHRSARIWPFEDQTVPDSLETYAQEASRAGRDGARAHAYLFYRSDDRRLQSDVLSGRYPTAAECQRICKLLSKLPPVTVDALAAQTDLPRRRLEITLTHLLRDGVVRMREERIARVAPAELPRTLSAVLASHARRRSGDRARLDAMMRYGQGVEDCRAARILAYFGDPTTTCGICDVCARDTRG